MKYRKGFKYQVAEDITTVVMWLIGYEVKTDFIELSGGDLLIKKGYAWDGASGPAIDTDNFMTPSLVHDALYQLMRMELIPLYYRKRIDELLVTMAKQRKMPWWRRAYVYFFVDLCAKKSALPSHARKVYEVK